VLPALTTMVLLAVALYLERRRDIGASLIPAREIVERPRLMLLRSPTLLALRSQTMSFVLWSIAIGSFAMVLGTVSKSVAQANLPESIKEQLTKLGGVDFTTPAGYIGLVFLFFVLALALFGCSQLASIREDESEGRLETLFAQPQGRYRWLAGRLSLAATGAILLALVAGLGAAAGVGVVGAGVAFHRLVETGLNCLPASLLFLGLGALLVALAPRAGVGLAYAVVGAAFIWELVGALLGVPSWMLGISPFHQISLMPAQSFRAEPAAVMLAIGLATAAASLVVFRRRDLAGA